MGVGAGDGVVELIGDGPGNFGVRKGVGCGDGVDWGVVPGVAACGDGVGACFGALGGCDGGCCASARYTQAKPIRSPNDTFIIGLHDRCWPMRVNQLKRFVTGFAVLKI